MSDTRAGRETGRQRPEYTGGIGLRGVEQIEQFVRAGGTLIALDQATEVPVQFFQISIRNALRPATAAVRFRIGTGQLAHGILLPRLAAAPDGRHDAAAGVRHAERSDRILHRRRSVRRLG